MQCNFQVAEVLATVIKKEKEDETENKSEYRCHSHTVHRSTNGSSSRGVARSQLSQLRQLRQSRYPGTICSATVCFVKLSLVGLVTRPAC